MLTSASGAAWARVWRRETQVGRGGLGRAGPSPRFSPSRAGRCAHPSATFAPTIVERWFVRSGSSLLAHERGAPGMAMPLRTLARPGELLPPWPARRRWRDLLKLNSNLSRPFGGLRGQRGAARGVQPYLPCASSETHVARKRGRAKVRAQKTGGNSLPRAQTSCGGAALAPPLLPWALPASGDGRKCCHRDTALQKWFRLRLARATRSTRGRREMRNGKRRHEKLHGTAVGVTGESCCCCCCGRRVQVKR